MKKHTKTLKILMVLAAAVLFDVARMLCQCFQQLIFVGRDRQLFPAPHGSQRTKINICSPFQCSLQPLGCDGWYFCVGWSVDMVLAETDLSLCRRSMVSSRDILIKDCIRKSSLLICDAMVSRNSARFSSVS